MPYYRRNIYILCVTIFLATLSWNQVVPFLPKFIKQIGGGQNLNYWIGVVFAVQSLAAIIMTPLWGKLGDTYGRKPMIIRAGICLTGVYYGMSVCQAPWHLAVCRFANGALTGFLPGSFALIATNTPEDHAPRYIAAAQTAQSVGLIGGPMVGAVLAMRFGYRGSMVISGTAVLISTLLVWLLVAEPNKVSVVQRTSLIEDFGIALRSRMQRSIMFVVMLTWTYSAAITPYLILHLESLARSEPEWLPAGVFALPSVAFVLSAYRWTITGEWWGYDRTILVGLFGGGVGALGLFFVHDIWVFGLVYFATGICTAALSPSIAAVTCTRIEESFRGRAYGIQQSAGTLGGLFAPLIAGAIATQWNRAAIFMFVGLVFVLGALVFRGMARWWAKE
jgi:DHA1 family multidrug resistance protein-like MFS transporter